MKQKGSSDVKGSLWNHLDKKVLLWHREAPLFLECWPLYERTKRKGSDVWPSMVSHNWNLCSAFNPSKCSWGFGALLKGLTSVVVLRVGESAGHSLPPPTFPAGPETWPATFGLQVRLSNCKVGCKVEQLRGHVILKLTCQTQPETICRRNWRHSYAVSK